MKRKKREGNSFHSCGIIFIQEDTRMEMKMEIVMGWGERGVLFQREKERERLLNVE